jgi:purine-cytosine permease-like protein
MVDDELPPSEDAGPEIPSGPRRSTYTPPPGGLRYDDVVVAGDAGDADDADDALAGAIAQEYQRWAPPPASDGPRIPAPPQRQSLSDAELVAAADPARADADSAALLDLVEQQLALRRAEAEQLAAWEASVRAAAPEDADALVAPVREQFRDLLPRTSGAVAPSQPASPSESVAERLVSAPPPAAAPVDDARSGGAPVDDAFAAPPLNLALADAPPPWGQVPSAVVPPPSFASPTSIDSPASAESPASVDSPASVESPPEPPPLVEPAQPSSASGSIAVVSATVPSPAEGSEGSLSAFEALLAEPESELAPELPPSAGPDTGAGGAPLVAESALVPPLAEHGEHAAVGEAVDTAETTLAREPGVEVIALEPTPAEFRAGRSIRLFWVWFAVNASVVSLALGAVILGLGLSLRQAVLAALIGVALSFLPLGLGTLAGKWSGQPTMVVSRATFGTVGNGIPALVALLTRLVWSAALLWMLGAGTAEILVGAGLVPGDARLIVALGAAAAGLVIAAVVAGIGFRALAITSAIVAALAAVLVAGLIVLTVSYVDLGVALSIPDGDWVLMLGGAVLVFSAIGLAWAMSSGDVARYQARGTSGSAALLWTALGATIPAFALITWGAVLAASNPVIAEGLQRNPLDLVARLLPLWYPAPLIAAVALSLLCGAVLALYSGGFALLAVGMRAPRWAGVLVVVLITGALTAALLLLVADTTALLRDVLTTAAVPIAAWAGIFGAETMIRSRRVHSPSLLRRGGVYPAVRWTNTVMLVLITAAAWGITTASTVGLTWQGYLLAPLGLSADAPLAAGDLGVLAALVLGLLTPLVAGIPALRALQTAERAATEAEERARVDTGSASIAPLGAPAVPEHTA